MGLNPSKHKFEVSAMEITKDHEAFIIELPNPQEVPEAFFVAAVFQIKKQLFSKSVESVRYFTLELGKNPYDLSSNEYHFCEWAGNMATSPRHENYGRIVRADEKLFASALKEVLSTGKLKKIEVEAKKPLAETTSNSREGLSNRAEGKPSKPSIPDISDFLLLVEKRKTLIEENAEKLSKNFDIIKNTSHKTFVQFVLENDSKRTVFPNGASDAQQYLDMSLSFTLRGIGIAFILGWEYAELYKENPKAVLTAERFDSVAIRESTQNELKRVSEYAIFWMLRLDEMCFFAGYSDKSTMLGGVDIHISQAQMCILAAFQDGVATYWGEVLGKKF
jgi:hypothetical protein